MKSTVKLEPLYLEEALALAPLVRPRDVVEVQRSHGCTIPQALEDTLRNPLGDAYLASIDGQPVALFGILPSAAQPGVASPWLLTLPSFTEHTRIVYALARQLVAFWNGRWPVLVQMVEADHVDSCRFLRALGFELQAPVEFGPEKALFHPALRRA